jgi:hypothetical protein
MRKLTAVCFALFITVSAVAAPNDSSDRRVPGSVPSLITRIVHQIKSIVRALDDPLSIPPQPCVPSTNP